MWPLLFSRRPKIAEMHPPNPPAMHRLIVLIISGLMLASCSGGIIGDYAPQWAGGFPKDFRLALAPRNTMLGGRNRRLRPIAIRRTILPRQKPTLLGSRGRPNRAGQDSRAGKLMNVLLSHPCPHCGHNHTKTRRWFSVIGNYQCAFCARGRFWKPANGLPGKPSTPLA